MFPLASYVDNEAMNIHTRALKSLEQITTKNTMARLGGDSLQFSEE